MESFNEDPGRGLALAIFTTNGDIPGQKYCCPNSGWFFSLILAVK
jgi:hypothetical protein